MFFCVDSFGIAVVENESLLREQLVGRVAKKISQVVFFIDIRN